MECKKNSRRFFESLRFFQYDAQDGGQFDQIFIGLPQSGTDDLREIKHDPVSEFMVLFNEFQEVAVLDFIQGALAERPDGCRSSGVFEERDFSEDGMIFGATGLMVSADRIVRSSAFSESCEPRRSAIRIT